MPSPPTTLRLPPMPYRLPRRWNSPPACTLPAPTDFLDSLEFSR
jgi:hypothetical protein